MDLKLGTYLIYLGASGALTIWVARTLFRHGQIFLDDALGNEILARSVNRLLVVGFYLLNLGYVALALKVDDDIYDSSEALEVLATKLGLVLLVLGVIHLFNVFVLSRYRRRRMLERARPPVPPTGFLPPMQAGPPPVPQRTTVRRQPLLEPPH